VGRHSISRFVTRRAAAWAAASTAVLGAVGATAAVPSLTGFPGNPAPACDTSWPMFQHDAGHSADGCSSVSQTTAPTLHPAWFDSTGGSAVTGEPVVSGGSVFFGDYGGVFHAVSAATGAERWHFDIATGSGPNCGADAHGTSYGAFPGTAAVATIGGGDPTVFVGGGGTLYAFDATTGTCLWSQNADPDNPTDAMEIESSPVLDTAVTPPLVIVGSDTNGGKGAMPGLLAFYAAAGTTSSGQSVNAGDLAWKYEPGYDRVVTTLHSPLDPNTPSGCGNVWSSPALDPAADGGQGLVVFGTADCGDASTPNFPEAEVAVDATTGQRVWHYVEHDAYAENPTGTHNFDDDFGASPIITPPLATAQGTLPLVVVGSKTGNVYGLDEATGAVVWGPVQAAQPGNFGTGPGAIGGFIGSPALGVARGRPTVFLTSAVPSPLAQGGLQGASGEPGGLTTFPDTSAACIGDPAGPSLHTPCDPLRATALHAVDAATGAVVWQAPLSTPIFGPATYANGVVYAPATTSFADEGYDADTGTQLWVAPLGDAPSSGTTVSGSSIFFGTGTEFAAANGEGIPPQVYGVWSFTTGVGAPTVNQLSS
jgi:polyvinyl alcohol dehydrogenase (cytochrome)